MNLMKKLAGWVAACGTILTIASASADDVRIAVAAEAPDPDAPVSSVAARAPDILIFDAERRFVASHRNPAAENPGGAGPALASWLEEQRVGTLIAGDFGSKLRQALKERNIRAVTASGSASQAARDIQQ